MSRRQADGPSGIAIVDKEPGWTSHDVVAKARNLLGTRKVGHSGTLDPDATGVLVLGVGRGTKLLSFLTGLPKSYVGEMVLGSETTTLDASGEVTATHDMTAVTPEQVAAAAEHFRGAIQQIPPMVSAVKIGGQRLHELARAGIEVERPPRSVRIDRLDVESVREPGVYRLTVDCSSGTYIRTLAADLGTALGGGAHLRSLRRTAVGPFTLADARPLAAIELLPLREGWRGRPVATVDAGLATQIGFGQVLPRESLGVVGAGPWGLCSTEGELLAVYEAKEPDRAKPALVLREAAEK